jgi:hypothetical protein
MPQHKAVYVTPLSGIFSPYVVRQLLASRSTPDVLIVRPTGDRPGFIMGFADYERWISTDGPISDLSPGQVAMNMSAEIDAIFEQYRAAIRVLKMY